MEKDILTKICIASTIIGIILLVIIGDKIEIQSAEISKITDKDINKVVKIRGNVQKTINKGTVSISDIQDKTGTITVVAFKPENLTIKKGSLLEIEGKVSRYENTLQIYADTLKILN